MVKVEFDEKKKEWIELPKGSEEGIYLDGKLKTKLDNIKMILKKNWDAVIIVDGLERSGKSTLGITCAYYLTDTKLNMDNICIGSMDAVEKLDKLPDGSLILIDEGSLVFSSMDVMRTESKRLNKILNVIGQKNMTLIIVAPSFFNLSKYISVERSRFLLHVYTDAKLNRGRYAYFSTAKKRILYDLGKKNYNSYRKPSADFIGRFVDFNPLGEEYIKLKKKSLMEALHGNDTHAPSSKDMKEMMNNLIKNNKDLTGKDKITNKQLSLLFRVNVRTIQRYKQNLLEKPILEDN